MERQREYWVDYTKVFACILVVLGHLLQGLNRANIQWNNNLYVYINAFIYIFHMPLFMCLSGYLYKKYTKIKDWKEYFIFVKKKFINLGIPYVVFYISYVLMNMLFSSSVNSQKGIQDILNILTDPMPPFWFLYALFFIFLVIPILEKIFKDNKNVIILTLFLAHIINVYIQTGIYAIDIVAEYAIYFYFGAYLSDKLKSSFKSKNVTILLIGFVILSLLYCYITLNNIITNNITILIKLILAIIGIIVNIQLFKNISKYIEKNNLFYLLSKYTFPIYLMHTFFSAGIRIVLLKLNIDNFYIQFILGFGLGIVGPILVAKILEKIKYGNIILYPLKTIKELKKADEKTCN